MTEVIFNHFACQPAATARDIFRIYFSQTSERAAWSKMGDEYGDDYEVPLEQKRPFGAGIKRKRIDFVKASDPDLSSTLSTRSDDSGSSISDFYLNLVLPDEKRAQTEPPPSVPQICLLCSLPVANDEPSAEVENDDDGLPASQAKTAKGKPVTARQRHDASIAHQVCLAHSHPPSALDRSRMGLTYLSSHGWDPDSRKGLGSSGQGIQHPLKAKAKEDKYGLGLELPKHLKGKPPEKKAKPLDAKKSKQKAEADKKKGEKLRELFYGNDDLQRYLGRGA